MMEEAIFDACYKGRLFRKPKGTVVWVADKLTNINAWNPSYSPHYYVRVRKFKDWQRTESHSYDYDFKKWVALDPLDEQDFEDKRTRAIDSVMGRPWYRSDAEEARLYDAVIGDESGVQSPHPDDG